MRSSLAARDDSARRRGFALLVAAELVSGTGSMMTALALPWFVLQITGSASRAAAVSAAEVVAIVLLGVPSGAVASRLGARRTLLLTQLIWAPLTALVPLLHYAGVLTFEGLLVIAFLSGTLVVPFFAAQTTIIPELLGEDHKSVARGNAILQGATRTTYWLGPLIAGILIARFETPVVMLIDSATFIVGFALYAAVPAPTQPVEAEHAKDLLAGVRFIRGTKFLRFTTAAQAISQASFQALTFALPALAFFL